VSQALRGRTDALPLRCTLHLQISGTTRLLFAFPLTLLRTYQTDWFSALLFLLVSLHLILPTKFSSSSLLVCIFSALLFLCRLPHFSIRAVFGQAASSWLISISKASLCFSIPTSKNVLGIKRTICCKELKTSYQANGNTAFKLMGIG